MQARGLDAAALEACARRAVLCDRAGEAGGDEALRRAPPPAGAVAACLRAEAFVHGAFARCGEALAARATAEAREPRQPVDPEAVAELVARAATGPDRGFSGDLPERCSAVLRAHAAHEHFRARTATPARLVERLRDRRLDLTRVRFDEIRLPSSAAAREAVLCLRVDGMVLPQVAVRAGVECAVQETEIEQLAGAMRTAIAAGRPGETIGPIPEDGDGGWRLAVLHERCAPTLDDARVRRRLIEEVAGLALARAAAGKVDWHGHV
jgi:hypothetical protein